MKPSPVSPAAISSGELYTIREAATRLRWGRKTMARAQRQGLPTVTFGREKYVRGEAIMEFFLRLEAGNLPTGDAE